MAVAFSLSAGVLRRRLDNSFPARAFLSGFFFLFFSSFCFFEMEMSSQALKARVIQQWLRELRRPWTSVSLTSCVWTHYPDRFSLYLWPAISPLRLRCVKGACMLFFLCDLPRNLTLENKIIMLLVSGIEPTTFRTQARRSTSWAISTPHICFRWNVSHLQRLPLLQATSL